MTFFGSGRASIAACGHTGRAYRNITKMEEGLCAMPDALAEGHALVWLEREKLSGGYGLQRIDDDKDQWLLNKMDDDAADARTKTP